MLFSSPEALVSPLQAHTYVSEFLNIGELSCGNCLMAVSANFAICVMCSFWVGFNGLIFVFPLCVVFS